MENEKIKVKRYEVYMGNSSVIIPAVGCFLVEDKLSFTNASGNEVALFNFNEITGYKLLDITEV